MGLDRLPACDHDIFRGRVDAAHEIDVEVHVAVVDAIDDLALDDRPERAEVDDVTGALIDPASTATSRT